MAYLFNTPDQQAEMLARIGVRDVESLFAPIPDHVRLDRPLDLPPPLTELELQAHLSRLAIQNVTDAERACFLGGGAYDHFIPAAVDEIASRGEFYTAYTPYQAEASQGTLQAFFEYQSLICLLNGMDTSNASLYEGGTAVSEAVFMALRVLPKRRRVVMLGSVHPEYRQVLTTYTQHLDIDVRTIPVPDGTADVDDVKAAITDETACVVIQYPNFYGCLEEVGDLVEAAHSQGALAIVSFDPNSLGILQKPGDYGADIAVAEGQGLGVPLQYGGPYLGILACRDEYVRKMPGRLIGLTQDRHGQPAYCLNLQTREQHIRRDKATSNICTNQGLLALRAAVHLSLLGPAGLREVSELCCRKAHHLADQLTEIGDIELAYDRPFFKEFVIRSSRGSEALMSAAREAGIDIGPRLSTVDPQETDGVLIAVTEKRTTDDMDHLVAALRNDQSS